MEILIGFAILFAVKVIDNILGTSKTILIQQNRGILAAINVVISQIIFYKLISAVNSSGDEMALYVVAVAAGVGTYIAIKINDRRSKDRVYVNVIMTDNKDAILELREYLIEHKIINLVTDGYTLNWDKTLAITAYAQTKDESKLLDTYILNSNIKFKRVVTEG